MRVGYVLVVAVALAAAPAWGADEPKSIPWVETGPFKHVDSSGPQRDARQLLLHQRNAATAASAPQAVSADVGDVAVVVDNGAIIVQPRPANPFDLAVPTALAFAPGTDTFSVAFAGTTLDGAFGANLGLGDDDTTEVTLAFSFTFLGTDYSSIWVNSDGNITLGAGDAASSARDAARHVSGPPRISPLLADLDPTSGGSVHADARSDRVVVTWKGVPEFGASNSNTLQAILHSNGNIDFVYADVDTSFGVVGVAEGNNEPPFNEVDLTADLPGTFAAGAIFEEFAPAVTERQMDVIALAQEFYETHADEYDFLVMFTDFTVDLQGAFAFHLGLKNETLGLGLRGTFDRSAVAGSGGELESILNMNRIGLYWPDANKMVNPPIKKFRFSASVPGATLDGPPGSSQTSRRARWMGTLNGDFGSRGSYTLGLNSAMSIMAQEAGHRWLAFPLFVHPMKGFNFVDNFDLLGRSNVHWSFFFNARVPEHQFPGDPRASGVEGNAIADLGADAFPGQLPMPCTAQGESTFLTEPDELVDGYTELDQYFMGLRLQSAVSPFWYADEPRSAFSGGSLEGIKSFAAQDDILFCGKRVNLTVGDIAATESALLGSGFPASFAEQFGPRVPAIGDEVDSCGKDVKTMAFILLVEQGAPDSPAHAAAIDQVDTFRTTWEGYANGPATDGRGLFDTSLNPVCH